MVQDDDKEVKRPRCELLHFCWPLSQFENNKIFPRFLVQLTCRQSFVSRISVNTKRKTKNTFSNVHITYSYSCNNVTRQCPSPFSNDISLLSLLLFLFPSQKKTAVYSRLFFLSFEYNNIAYRFALWRAERKRSWENLMNVSRPSPKKGEEEGKKKRQATCLATKAEYQRILFSSHFFLSTTASDYWSTGGTACITCDAAVPLFLFLVIACFAFLSLIIIIIIQPNNIRSIEFSLLLLLLAVWYKEHEMTEAGMRSLRSARCGISEFPQVIECLPANIARSIIKSRALRRTHAHASDPVPSAAGMEAKGIRSVCRW